MRAWCSARRTNEDVSGGELRGSIVVFGGWLVMMLVSVVEEVLGGLWRVE